MKDTLSSIISYLFAEDKKSHHMPQKATAALFQNIKNLLQKREENK